MVFHRLLARVSILDEVRRGNIQTFGWRLVGEVLVAVHLDVVVNDIDVDVILEFGVTVDIDVQVGSYATDCRHHGPQIRGIVANLRSFDFIPLERLRELNAIRIVITL